MCFYLCFLQPWCVPLLFCFVLFLRALYVDFFFGAKFRVPLFENRNHFSTDSVLHTAIYPLYVFCICVNPDAWTPPCSEFSIFRCCIVLFCSLCSHFYFLSRLAKPFFSWFLCHMLHYPTVLVMYFPYLSSCQSNARRYLFFLQMLKDGVVSRFFLLSTHPQLRPAYTTHVMLMEEKWKRKKGKIPRSTPPTPSTHQKEVLSICAL